MIILEVSGNGKLILFFYGIVDYNECIFLKAESN